MTARSSGHYGYTCPYCLDPIVDGQHVTDDGPYDGMPMHTKCYDVLEDGVEAYEERRRRRLAEAQEY